MIQYNIGDRKHFELTDQDFYPPEDKRLLRTYIKNTYGSNDYYNFRKAFYQYCDAFTSTTGDISEKTMNDICL